ncbi:MAG: Asp-tRNA(Asn)/Glu-tRNA(Gln) amidotransferase subunit GatC [Clostridia bacterium]|nr:Asp-tRNA(Asn)/Glu-tRNA(Gln) amidotransferase subunit GatC [Clostridia bacterium]
MKITIKEIEHLASLSALDFSAEEKEKFVKDLGNILEMVNKLQTAETGDDLVFNKSHKLSQLREDIAEESLPQEEILKNAPKQRRGCFNVPLVVE